MLRNKDRENILYIYNSLRIRLIISTFIVLAYLLAPYYRLVVVIVEGS